MCVYVCGHDYIYIYANIRLMMRMYGPRCLFLLVISAEMKDQVVGTY